jgi:hypothetical protein
MITVLAGVVLRRVEAGKRSPPDDVPPDKQGGLRRPSARRTTDTPAGGAGRPDHRAGLSPPSAAPPDTLLSLFVELAWRRVHAAMQREEDDEHQQDPTEPL